MSSKQRRAACCLFRINCITEGTEKLCYITFVTVGARFRKLFIEFNTKILGMKALVQLDRIIFEVRILIVSFTSKNGSLFKNAFLSKLQIPKCR